MHNVILFDDETRDHLLPLTYTRPVGAIRIGIMSMAEKWANALDAEVSFITQEYLVRQFPLTITEDNFVINGAVLPSAQLVRLITQLEENEALMHGTDLIAARLNQSQFERLMTDQEIEELQGVGAGRNSFQENYACLRHLSV